MNSYSKIQVYISTLLFIVINVLFYFKYIGRVSPLIGVASILCYIVFIYFL